eukprot:CAMPEP_0194345632 /NCGR_PEP_ID=MMETSP0171-20130528/104971_1 /TAXON_ID=218684 /ORGANISM="Corethron pennatum, Strain L29A3" /LENGTH=363 /DNA_ID=CAMNT_0039112653 /DNA_START=43 /DNA_END=1132 /DNA_ORIENTATION=+
MPSSAHQGNCTINEGAEAPVSASSTPSSDNYDVENHPTINQSDVETTTQWATQTRRIVPAIAQRRFERQSWWNSIFQFLVGFTGIVALPITIYFEMQGDASSQSVPQPSSLPPPTFPGPPTISMPPSQTSPILSTPAPTPPVFPTSAPAVPYAAFSNVPNSIDPPPTPPVFPTSAPAVPSTPQPSSFVPTRECFGNNNLRTAIDLWFSNRDSADRRYGPIGSWRTCDVTYFNSLFENRTSFDDNLQGWDASQVTDVGFMFKDAVSFDGDISEWDMSALEKMEWMFLRAVSFNGNISAWNTAKVTTMWGLFYGATSFDGDISDWDTSRTKNMREIFTGATSFNGDLSGWDTSNAETIQGMFQVS